MFEYRANRKGRGWHIVDPARKLEFHRVASLRTENPDTILGALLKVERRWIPLSFTSRLVPRSHPVGSGREDYLQCSFRSFGFARRSDYPAYHHRSYRRQFWRQVTFQSSHEEHRLMLLAAEARLAYDFCHMVHLFQKGRRVRTWIGEDTRVVWPIDGHELCLTDFGYDLDYSSYPRRVRQ